MKIKSTSVLIVLLLMACTKENNNNTQLQAPVQNNNASIDPVAGLTPLDDLDTGTYKGYVGGLYPNGVNSPSGTYADDLLAVSNSIVPLDTFGNPSSKSNARILFISLGASTGSDLMAALRAKTIANPATNPLLHLMNCNHAKTGVIPLIMQPGSSYWAHVSNVFRLNHVSYRQVQIIYMETDDSTTIRDFPDRPDLVKNHIEACMQVMKQKCPNLKILYVLGRIRSFGNNTAWNREPSPYYFGWSCKWAIEDQINGVPGTEYKGPNAVAPMITWGFYEWATTIPRTTDGFSWLRSESSDGLHATPAGVDTLATHFQKFLLRDQYASIWYAAH